MGVIDGETAGTVMQLTGKGVEISADILKAFLDWLINIRHNYLENVLASEKIKQTKADNELTGENIKLAKEMRRTMDAKMAVQEGKVLISAQTLSKSGEPIMAGAAALTEQQQKEFAILAKRYGLTYTLIKNDYDPSNKKIIMFMQKDVHKVKDITDRMTENAQVREIDKRIDLLKSKGMENLTKQDYLDLAQLEDLRDSKIAGPINILNKAENEKTFEEISGELKAGQQQGSQPMTFERALNHITSRDYSSKEPYYLAERLNPNKYIQMDSARENFAGEDYTKTDYSIYQDGVKVGSYDDGRFEGRVYGGKDDYWKNLKDTMKIAGDFSDDVLIFRTKGEFDQYVSAYNISVERAQNQEMSQTLYDVGAYFDETAGEARDFQSEELIKELANQDNLTEDECLRIAKAIVIADQIKIVKNLEILDNEEARVNYLMRSVEPNTRKEFYLTDRLNLIQTEQEKYKELGKEKATLYNKLCSMEAISEL